MPGQRPDPCTADLTATVIAPSGRPSIAIAPPNPDQPVDCFYVYPTVSTQPTPNANLQIDPAEENVALLQAARFSLDCRVYAPMYRQATLRALFDGGVGVNRQEAYDDVLMAWRDYLAHDNHGRGVVLIGHSQGSRVLEQLLVSEIDKNPSEVARLVSAVILGGNVLVPAASSVSGPATTNAPGGALGQSLGALPPCRSRKDTGCVVAYSSFDTTPPPASRFGRSSQPGMAVLCVNPADPSAPSGRFEPITPYLPVRDLGLLGGTRRLGITTPWVAFPGVFTAACEQRDGASWLQVDGPTTLAAGRPYLITPLGPRWGLHLVDVTIALGELVGLVHDQANAWVQAHGRG